jgi:RNA polymerase sigma factor, sigma-70 family
MEIKSTDAKAFRLIYDANYELLMKVTYHVVYNLDIAEDLTQEAFERFYVKNMTFPSEDDAKYWLLRVAKNLALNHIRRNKREIEMVAKVKMDPGAKSYVEDGASELVKAETVKEVRNALGTLPEKLRTVLILKEYGDMDYKGIGQVLGISESNVKVRVFRARKKLEELLATEESHVY